MNNDEGISDFLIKQQETQETEMKRKKEKRRNKQHDDWRDAKRNGSLDWIS
jgi:hypothetical protein